MRICVTAAAAIATGFAIAAILAAFATAAARVDIESTVQDVRISDVGPPGASVGDTRSEVLYLWNRAIRPTPIGNAYLLCTTLGRHGIYGRRPASMCDGIYNMPRGKLLVRGVRRSNRFYSFAITGGTGIYRGATGSLNVRPREPRFLETFFVLTSS